MKSPLLSKFSGALLSLYLLTGCAAAQPRNPVTPNMATTVKADNLDGSAFAQWDNGEETKISGTGKNQNPNWVIYSQSGTPGFNGYWFGDSKLPGVRHLRIGFKSPIDVGSVLVRGGGSLSVLKPNAAYPGDLNDDSQWAPAQRLVDGSPSDDEVANDDYALWTLPAGTQTQALRFSHTAQATDTRFAGWLGEALVMSDRLANIAPQAQASASAETQNVSRINNESSDGTWKTWENYPPREEVPGTVPVVSEQNAQWVMLVWPEAVKISGLEAIFAGFSSAEAQAYNGPASRHPRDAEETDWQTVGSYTGIKNGYPVQMWPNRLDFGKVVTTRAIRLRITGPTDEGHPHLVGNTRNGKRIWLGDLMALQPLANASLQAVKLAPSAANFPHPPIPVRFTLAKPGYVTLVIEDTSGKRVRNLVSETYFPAGSNVAWWDGTDDLGRDTDAARHGLYRIPAKFVAPGQYQVRGLVRDAIGVHYELSVNTAGNPPWNLPDHTGAWLANHTPPQAALFVPGRLSPAGKDVVLLGSAMSEGTDGVAWVDLTGRKLGGKTWVGGNYSGAPFMARDLGQEADDAVYAYVASTWDDELRLTALQTKAPDKPVLPPSSWKFPGPNKDAATAKAKVGGIAAYNGLLAISLTQLDQILFVDAKAGRVVGTSKTEDPRGLVFDAKGRLFVLSNRKLVRFDLLGGASLPAADEIVGAGLEDPSGVALDARGTIYISDRGSSHQVKVFDASGKLVRTIGKAGAPQAGPYDPLHMNNPQGLTVDSQNQLWVTENDYLPKRVSVWSPDGNFIKAFYGPSKYGGGGTLDSNDKSKFYYADESHGTLEFRLDWQKGSFELANVLYRPTAADLPMAFRSAAPETPLYRNGHRFFTNCYNSNPVSGHGTAFLFSVENGILKPVAAAGRASEWSVLKMDAFKGAWPAGVNLADNGRTQAFFVWSDTNGDAQVQPSEVDWRVGESGGVTVLPDLSFVVSRVNGVALQIAPSGFSKNGIPVYNLDKAKVLAEGVANPASTGGDQMLVGQGGLTIATLGIKPFHPYSLSGLKNGTPLWSYPNPWPGLHASHEAAKPDRPGEVIGATRLLGGFIDPPGSDAGEIWVVNGNMGNMYLFTSDGLFIATLFKDVRQGKLWQMPFAKRGTDLDGITLHDENFWPTLTQTSDGQVYIQDGTNSSLIRVDGLNSVKRLPVTPLTVSVEDLANAQKYLISAEAERQQAQGLGALQVNLKAQAPTLDGRLDDWAGASWVDIDKSGVAANFNSNSKAYDVSAAISISGDKLYTAFRTDDPNLLQNSGEMKTALFKTGGALDLMIGTDPKADPNRAAPVSGDIRLLVTRVQGKTTAMLYRAVVPGTANPIPFSSPTRTITLDRVEDVSSQVQLAGNGGNYEFSIPLATLGLTPRPGTVLKGDIGILRGDGAQTTSRTYWANKATGITADVPSEATLTPNLWGPWKLQ